MLCYVMLCYVMLCYVIIYIIILYIYIYPLNDMCRGGPGGQRPPGKKTKKTKKTNFQNFSNSLRLTSNFVYRRILTSGVGWKAPNCPKSSKISIFHDFDFSFFHENFKPSKINEIFIVGQNGRTKWKVSSKTPIFLNKNFTSIPRISKKNQKLSPNWVGRTADRPKKLAKEKVLWWW